MKYGLDISPAGPWGHPGQIAELAALAEQHGWDGVFCEDYIAFPGGVDTYDPWITLALVAEATERVMLATMVTPLPRRRPWTIASQAMTVDRISGGRLALGVGIGDSDSDDFRRFGEAEDLRERAEILDEALEVIVDLWSGQPVTLHGHHFDVEDAQLRPTPTQQPRIPIWVGGAITKRRPRERALRWDGACLYRIPPDRGWEDVTADDVRRLRESAEERPGGGDGFVITVGGRECAEDLAQERRHVTALAAAGADWWHEYVPPRFSLDEARRRIMSGPVRATMDG
jgi:alkanesulfonate monooxygenase SsuD/methylene tetrahydromethanopterin reductase-like flavin-dependent oxidoreductase (luciferase family)